jgi:8-oxo-dGTP pyrophosphatase MutT (NUDIX family)
MTIIADTKYKRQFGLRFNHEESIINWRTKTTFQKEGKVVKEDYGIANNEVYNLDKSAGFLFFNEDYTKILLVRSTISNKFGPPKGHANNTDINSFHTACREVKEEIGIEIPNDKKYEVIKFKKTLFYIMIIPESMIFSKVDKNEISEIKWFSIIDIYECVKKDSTLFISAIRNFVKNDTFNKIVSDAINNKDNIDKSEDKELKDI